MWATATGREAHAAASVRGNIFTFAPALFMSNRAFTAVPQIHHGAAQRHWQMTPMGRGSQSSRMLSLRKKRGDRPRNFLRNDSLKSKNLNHKNPKTDNPIQRALGYVEGTWEAICLVESKLNLHSLEQCRLGVGNGVSSSRMASRRIFCAITREDEALHCNRTALTNEARVRPSQGKRRRLLWTCSSRRKGDVVRLIVADAAGDKSSTTLTPQTLNPGMIRTACNCKIHARGPDLHL